MLILIAFFSFRPIFPIPVLIKVVDDFLSVLQRQALSAATLPSQDREHFVGAERAAVVCVERFK